MEWNGYNYNSAGRERSMIFQAMPGFAAHTKSVLHDAAQARAQKAVDGELKLEVNTRELNFPKFQI